MKSTLGDNLTCDAFLDGKLRVWQPKQGYRAGIDPVLLAASVPALANETALELGCGVGVASLCLAWRTGAQITGLEVQDAYAALAQRNAAENNLPIKVMSGNIQNVPAELRSQSYDHVFANPPYYVSSGRSASPNKARERAVGEQAALRHWIDTAIRRLRPKGRLTFIQKADRLPDLLNACDDRLGDLTILPVTARQGRPAELVILRARKSARGPFRICAPFVLHDGERHEKDADDYSKYAREVFRIGASLEAAFKLHK